MSANHPERHFSRIPFYAETQILSTDSDQKWPCNLIDISLHGAFTSLPKNWPAKCGDNYKLELQLGSQHDESLCLHMDVKVSHMELNHVGFEIVKMDVDTASHLHRLIELNEGDTTIMERELSELIKLHNSGT